MLTVCAIRQNEGGVFVPGEEGKTHVTMTCPESWKVKEIDKYEYRYEYNQPPAGPTQKHGPTQT